MAQPVKCQSSDNRKGVQIAQSILLVELVHKVKESK